MALITKDDAIYGYRIEIWRRRREVRQLICCKIKKKELYVTGKQFARR